MKTKEETIMANKKVYYGMYAEKGFGAYSNKWKMENDMLYIDSEVVEEFDDPDAAKWFAEEGFDSLNREMNSEEILDGRGMKLNWFYRIPK